MFRLGSFLFARRAPFLGAIVAIIALATSALVPSSAARAASVGSDRAVSQLQHAIARKGAEIEALVIKMKPARTKLDVLQHEISHDEQILVHDARTERATRSFEGRTTVFAGIGHSTAGIVWLPFFDSATSMTQAMSGRNALDSVKSHLDDSITRLERARSGTDDGRRNRMANEIDARQTLDRLTRIQSDASAAITAENATLARVGAELTGRLVERKHQREAQALRASQHAITEALAAATRLDHAARNARRGVSASKHQSPSARPKITATRRSGYENPLRALSGLTPERIDQGVDYGGVGPVYAIANGVVLNVYASGWPGGTFIAYQLSDGPARGLVVFTAEDLNPQVSVGSRVTANTVIGHMYGGPHGIEIGWADASTIPRTMAGSAAQYHGGNSTAFGENFSRLLQSVGAPGGILRNDPVGNLPSGWPQW